MFKAKIIKSDTYYKLRRKQMLLTLLPSILIAFLVNYYQFTLWLNIFMIGIYILLLVLVVINHKRMKSLLENEILEIDEKELRIISHKGARKEVFILDELDKLILKKKYSLPQETMKDVGKEIAGEPNQNYLILQQNGQDRRLDFEIASYFNLKQLDKLIESWESSDYNIAKVSPS